MSPPLKPVTSYEYEVKTFPENTATGKSAVMVLPVRSPPGVAENTCKTSPARRAGTS